jgi:hypothetical protein
MNPFKQLFMLYHAVHAINPSHAAATNLRFFQSILNQCQQLVVYNPIHDEPIATSLYASYEYAAYFCLLQKNYIRYCNCTTGLILNRSNGETKSLLPDFSLRHSFNQLFC